MTYFLYVGRDFAWMPHHLSKLDYNCLSMSNIELTRTSPCTTSVGNPSLPIRSEPAILMKISPSFRTPRGSVQKSVYLQHYERLGHALPGTIRAPQDIGIVILYLFTNVSIALFIISLSLAASTGQERGSNPELNRTMHVSSKVDGWPVVN